MHAEINRAARTTTAGRFAGESFPAIGLWEDTERSHSTRLCGFLHEPCVSPLTERDAQAPRHVENGNAP